MLRSKINTGGVAHGCALNHRLRCWQAFGLHPRHELVARTTCCPGGRRPQEVAVDLRILRDLLCARKGSSAPGQQVARATQTTFSSFPNSIWERRLSAQLCRCLFPSRQEIGNGIASASAFPNGVWERGESQLSVRSQLRLLHALDLEQARRTLVRLNLAAHDHRGIEPFLCAKIKRGRVNAA